MANAEAIRDINVKIALQAQRLKDEPELAPRVKKRIFQKIGKLKSELVSLGGTYAEPSLAEMQTLSQISNKEEGGDEEDRPMKRAKVEQDEEDVPIDKPSLSKKENKAMIHFVAKQLNELAQKKQLSKAKQLFKQSLKKGLSPDIHCFAGLLNVYVRCNDIAGAMKVFENIKQSSIEPNIVVYTTLLKGFCEVGRLAEATALYSEMLEKNQHNIRSLSTFLRGCLRTGSVSQALSVFQRSKHLLFTEVDGDGEGERWQDCAVVESMVSLLCRALRFDEAAQVVLDYLSTTRRDRGGGLWVLESAGLHMLLARTCAIRGVIDEARKYLSMAQSSLQSTAQMELTEKMRAKFHQQDMSADREKQESGALFQAHKRAQLQEDIEELEDYLATLASAQVAASLTAEQIQRIAAECYARTLGQLLWFGYNGQGDLQRDGLTNMGDILLQALREKAGLTSDRESTIRDRVIGALHDRKRIDLDAIFPDCTGDMPTFLEVGAGHGDWVVAQAAFHRDERRRARWMAAELRFDRCHDILCHSFFDQRQSVSAAAKSPSAANNLVILGGDAHRIVTQHLPSAALSGVFINYPQPPERSGLASQGQHLLTPSFFVALHNALQQEGRLTLLTDNMPYALQLARSLAEDLPRHHFRDTKLVESAECMVQEVVRAGEQAVTVYRGQPGPDCGHNASAHSYFDRLWSHGQKRRRWFFCVQKVA